MIPEELQNTALAELRSTAPKATDQQIASLLQEFIQFVHDVVENEKIMLKSGVRNGLETTRANSMVFCTKEMIAPPGIGFTELTAQQIFLHFWP